MINNITDDSEKIIEIPASVTVICLGNICRSPVGEYLLRYYAKKTTILTN